jgi:single-strand DNA-binding protein
MSQDNQITLRGYLTAEPKFFQKTPTAVPVTEIRVGSTPRRLNRETGEWQDLPTSYYRVKCWRRLAVNAVSSLHKGDMVVIRGRFYMTQWVDNQQRPRTTLEIEADSVGHDLAYGWSHFMRGSRSPGSRSGVDTGEMARQDVTSPRPDDSDDEYPPEMDVGELDAAELDAGETQEAVPAPGDQDAPERFGDPLAATTGMPVTDGDGGSPEFGGILAASGLTDDSSLTQPVTQETDSQAEAVPF